MSIKDYFFKAPSHGKLPQGVVWEKFMKYVGKGLELSGVKVSFGGDELISNGKVILVGNGAVGTRGYHYIFKCVDDSVSGKLEQSLDWAANKIAKEKPGIRSNLRHLAYRIGFV